jgi:hypothetical protein
MKQLTIYLMAVMMIVGYSCKDDDPITPTGGARKLTIGHFGVDWSEGKVGSEGSELDFEKIDGETIAWCPNGDGGGWQAGIWYRASSEKLYKMTVNEWSGATSIDTTRWSDDVCATPLRNGDFWGTKANDGYVIFKVIAVAQDSAGIANSPEWKAEVEYKFSSTTSF